MTKEQLNTAMAILEAHSEERTRQHQEIMAKLDVVIKNTKQDITVWIVIVSLFTVMAVETVVSLIH